jgi:hypothetical protein
MGIVLKFPIDRVDYLRSTDFGRNAVIVALPTAATPYDQARRAYAKAMAAWVNMMLGYVPPPDNTG